MTRLLVAEIQRIKQILLDRHDPDVLVDLLQITGRDIVDNFEEAVVQYYHENPDDFSYESGDE